MVPASGKSFESCFASRVCLDAGAGKKKNAGFTKNPAFLIKRVAWLA
jgi:hypothetical protein